MVLSVASMCLAAVTVYPGLDDEEAKTWSGCCNIKWRRQGSIRSYTMTLKLLKKSLTPQTHTVAMSLWLVSGPLPQFSVSLSRFYDSYSFIFCDPFPSFLSVYLICMTRTVLYSVTPSPSFLSVCLISMTRTVLHSVTPSPSSLSVCLVSMARTVVSCPPPLPRFSVSLSRFYDSYSFILCDPFPQFSVSLSHFYDSYSFVFCDPLSGFLSVCLISMTCTVLSSVTLSPVFCQFVSFR